MDFATFDKDTPGKCAAEYKSAFWFNNCVSYNPLAKIASKESLLNTPSFFRYASI